MIRQLIRKHPFWTYYVLAVCFPVFLMGYLVVAEIILQGTHGADFSAIAAFGELREGLRAKYPVLFHHADSYVLYISTMFLFPVGFPFFFFPAAPTTSALIVTALARGKAAIRALLRLYLPIQGSLTAREGLRIYGALLAGLAFMVMAACLHEYFFGEPERVRYFLVHLGVIDWQIFLGAWVMALFFNQGAALEELGWRGYALPLLIRKFGSPLGATLVLGVCWALWHFPREVPPLLMGQQTVADLLVSQSWFILSCVSMSIVATYFTNITGGSVLPVIMIHGTLNHVGGMFSTENVGMRTSFTGESPLMWFCAALVVLLLAGSDLGWRRRLELHGGKDPSDAWVDDPPRL